VQGELIRDFVAAMEQCSARESVWFLVPATGQSRDPAGKEPHAETSGGQGTGEIGRTDFGEK
jgi:hypothetical protein